MIFKTNANITNILQVTNIYLWPNTLNYVTKEIQCSDMFLSQLFLVDIHGFK